MIPITTTVMVIKTTTTNTTIATITPTLELLLLSDCEDELSVGEVNSAIVVVVILV